MEFYKKTEMTRKRTSTTLVVLQQTADIAGAGDAAIKTAGTTKMTSTNGHVRNAILALMAAFFLRDVIKYLGRVVLFRFLVRPLKKGWLCVCV